MQTTVNIDEPVSWFFEGAEKLLEVWFNKTREEQSLRKIPRAELDTLCKIAHCEIVSEMHNEHIDAYVLSESSLFISDRRVVMKTCGTTRLLDALPTLLTLAQQYAGMTLCSNVFYSRKNFVRPHEQPDAHKSFDAETRLLDKRFGGGACYALGNVLSDRWYLYTLPFARGRPIDGGDQTLEILMQDLDPRVMNIFTTTVCSNGAQATKLAGIAQLMPPNTKIDDKLFSPCGYSMNGIIDGTSQYCTIHVTPENEFSYVSFETNQKQQCYYQQTRKVLSCFRPGKFILTVFADRNAHSGSNAQKKIWNCHLDGYARSGLQFLLLPEHTLVYAHYTRLPGDDGSSDSGYGDNDS